MRVMASQFTGYSTVCLTDCSHWQQRNHQNYASLNLCEANQLFLTGGFPSQRASDEDSGMVKPWPCKNSWSDHFLIKLLYFWSASTDPTLVHTYNDKNNQHKLGTFLLQNTALWIFVKWIMMTSSKWKHFPRCWPFVRGIHRSPVNSSHKGQWRGALMFSLIFAWMDGWVNNREDGDLRRPYVHYDVTVMIVGFVRLLFPHTLHTVCCGHQIGLIYFIQYFQLVFLWNAFGRPTRVFHGRFTWYLNGILEFCFCMVMTWFAVLICI